MRTIMFLTIVSIALLSCTNEAGKEKRPASGVKEVKTEESVSKFTISTEQDTVKEGESITRYKNGAVKLQGTRKNGKRDGVWKSFYENGKPWSETTFKDGVKNGKTTTWFENGRMRYQGEYTNDVESGKWIYYDESGKQVMEKDYGKE